MTGIINIIGNYCKQLDAATLKQLCMFKTPTDFVLFFYKYRDDIKNNVYNTEVMTTIDTGECEKLLVELDEEGNTNTNTMFTNCFNSLISEIIDIASNKVYIYYTNDGAKETNESFLEMMKSNYNKSMATDFPEDMQKYKYSEGYAKTGIIYGRNSKQYIYKNGAIYTSEGTKVTDIYSYCIYTNNRYEIKYSINNNITVNYKNEYDSPYSKFYGILKAELNYLSEEGIDIVDFLKEEYYKGILQRFTYREIEDKEVDYSILGEYYKLMPRTYEKFNGKAANISSKRTYRFATSRVGRNKYSPLIVPFAKVLKNTNTNEATFYIEEEKIPECCSILIKLALLTKAQMLANLSVSSTSSEDNYSSAFVYYDSEGQGTYSNYYKNGELYLPKTYADYYNSCVNYINTHYDELKEEIIKDTIGFMQAVFTPVEGDGNEILMKNIGDPIDSKVLNLEMVTYNNVSYMAITLNTDIDSSQTSYIQNNHHGYLKLGRLSTTLIDNMVSNIVSSNLTTLYTDDLRITNSPNTRYDSIEYSSLFDDRTVGIVSKFNDLTNPISKILEDNKILIDFRNYFDKFDPYSVVQITLTDGNNEAIFNVIGYDNLNLILQYNSKYDELKDTVYIKSLAQSEGCAESLVPEYLSIQEGTKTIETPKWLEVFN